MRAQVDIGVPVLLLDSIAEVEPGDVGAVVVCGSHGGASAASYALSVPLAGVVFNDAGVGKDGAGIAGLALLDAAGVPAAAVGHLTARIGEARDTWYSGVVAHANSVAAARGVRAGQRVSDAAALLAGQAAEV